MKPAIHSDGDGLCFEWWSGDRKLTMYASQITIIRVSGPDIEHDMRCEMYPSCDEVRNAFDWLQGRGTE